MSDRIIDTTSLNGLRGLAAMHVAVGHFFIFSQEPTQGIDFIGGAVMPLFFLISGYVMVIGYGQKRYKPNPAERCGCCCQLFDAMNCCVPQLSRRHLTDDQLESESFNPRLFSDPEAAIDYFPSQKFYIKRVSRLAPVYYFTNLVAIPLAFLTMALWLFIYSLILSLFLVSSWLIVGPLNGVLWTISTMGFFYCMFPHLVVRLQQLRTAVDFRNLAWKMYWIQLIVFFVVVFLALLARIDVFVAYFMWRMFPANRLPVFVMGCCLGYMRVLSAQLLDDFTPEVVVITPSPSQSPVLVTTMMSPQEEDHVVAQKPFCVAPGNVLSPAMGYVFVVLLGVGLHFVSPTAAFFLRVLIEPAVPALFFDWILTLTAPRRCLSSGAPPAESMVEIFLKSRFMLFMGRISLCFYACHLLISGYVGMIIYYSRHGKLFMSQGDTYMQPVIIPSWAIMIVFPLSIFAGWLMTIYIEAPMQKWLSKKLSSPLSERQGGGDPAPQRHENDDQAHQHLASHFETSNLPEDSGEVRISTY